MTTVAILTADQAAGERLRHGLQSFESALLLRMVRDEPDVSLRSLRISDVVICGYDVSRERVARVLRALGSTGEASRLIRVIPSGGAHDAVFDTLALGARGVIWEDLIETDVAIAVREVARGRVYLSPNLVPLVLARYRELCGQLQRLRGGAERTALADLLRSFTR